MKTPLKNPGVIKYTGVINQSDPATNSWAWVEFPYDLKELYGKGNLVPAVITFDGIAYRGSITKMGGPYPMLLIRRDVMAKLGKSKGEKVEVTVTLDDKPREVNVPDELKKLLDKNKTAREIFEKLAYTHRREFAQWVGGAKQAKTREDRAVKAIGMILAKAKK